jgi:hypothetical protein
MRRVHLQLAVAVARRDGRMILSMILCFQEADGGSGTQNKFLTSMDRTSEEVRDDSTILRTEEY